MMRRKAREERRTFDLLSRAAICSSVIFDVRSVEIMPDLTGLEKLITIGFQSRGGGGGGAPPGGGGGGGPPDVLAGSSPPVASSSS